MAEQVYKDVEVEYGGSMKIAGGFILKIAGPDGAANVEGLIVQNIDIGAARPVTILYDLTSKYAYYISGRPQVQIGIQRMVGPRGIVREFYNIFGDVCKAANMELTFPEWCSDELKLGKGHNGLKANRCTLNNTQFQCNVQTYAIAENCQLQAINLEFLGGDTDAPYVEGD